jgi:hypothetical protein
VSREQKLVALTALVVTGRPVQCERLAIEWKCSVRTVRALLKDVREALVRAGLDEAA